MSLSILIKCLVRNIEQKTDIFRNDEMITPVSAVPCTENFGALRFTSLGSMHRSGIPIFDSIRFRI